jgi:RHS repeat-associated protein
MNRPNPGYRAWRGMLLLVIALLVSWLWILPDWPARAASVNRPPVANAGADQTVDVGDTVVLDGSGSSDADGNPLTFHWSFASRPGGSIATLSDPLAVRPTFQTDQPGTYVVQLIVNDGQVDSAPDAVTISTINSAPVARAGPDQTVKRGQTVVLDGSHSFDADGDPLAYAWSLVSRPTGSIATLSNPTTINPSFVVDKSGKYVVQLVVNDGRVNSLPEQVTISTTNSPPVAHAGADQTAEVGDTIVLDGSASTDVDGNLLSYAWALLSRPAGSAAGLQPAISVRPRLVIDKPGDYVAQLIVSDGKIASEPATVTISTLGSAPVAHAGEGRLAIVGDVVQLDGGGSTDVDGDSLQFIWSILSKPAQSAATLSSPFVVNPTFGVDKLGSYVVQLSVDDGTFTSGPDTVVISTSSRPPVARAGLNQTVTRGSTVRLDGSASSDPNGQTLTFHWALLSKPPGSLAKLSSPRVAAPSFVADLTGDYVAQLIVSDAVTAALSAKRTTGKGKITLSSAPDTTLISTVNSAPIADPGVDQSVAAGTTVQLDGSASFDPDKQALAFDWALTVTPPGSQAALSNASAAKPTFVADQGGVYVAQLIVSDGLLVSAPETAMIIATGQANQAPHVDAGSDQTITLPATAAFNGTVTDDGLPNPPAAVTTTWSKVSGPGTVNFTNVNSLVTSASFSQTGVYVLRLTANDGALGASDDVQITVNAGANQAPVTQNDSAATTPGFAVQSNVLANDSDPEGDALTVTAFTQGAHGTVTCLASGLCSYKPNAGFSGQDTFTYTASDGHGGQTVGTVSVTVASGDPTITAPPTTGSFITPVARSTKFLYTGANPVQTGVAPGTIEDRRAAVLRGVVTTRDGAVLPGVTVSILSHPEFGQTVTRANGAFDLAVNGGGLLTINYDATGFLGAQKQVNVPWQDYVPVPAVALIPLDTRVTLVTANAGAPQIHQANVMTDNDGTRRTTILIPSGTTATMTFANGSQQPLSTMHIRATEYTVGPNGPVAMPAALPPLSGYTYCVEFSADEAIAAGAVSVTFNQPVLTYVENFLKFPVGLNVPVGFYDRQTGVWVPSLNGRAVKIVSVTGGLADVDTDGDGVADNGLGITSEERASLASLYAPGQQLWRLPIQHFSPGDANSPRLPDGATPPGANGAGPDPNEPLEDPQCSGGSVVECENQVLGEIVPIVGTPFALNYRSDRVPGLAATRTIRLSGSSVPDTLSSIGLHMSVAGRSFDQGFAAAPNQQTTFVWDRLDAYGRQVLGGQTLNVTIDYNYPANYQDPGPQPNSFNGIGGVALIANPARQEAAISQSFTTTIGEGLTDARILGLGGWTLSGHQIYDPIARVMHSGNGSRVRAGSIARTMTFVHLPGKSILFDIDVGPDGSQYVALPHGDLIIRIAPDGSQTVVAGNGTEGFSGDGGPATQAELGDPTGVAVGPDGSLYIAEESNNRVRKVTPDGKIATFAGNGSPFFSGDGGPATQAGLAAAERIAVAPDSSVYLLDVGAQRIRRITTDGIINTVAGNGGAGFSGDGGPATSASLNASSVSVAPDGGFYIADFFNGRVRRVGLDGIINTVVNYSSVHGQPVSVRPTRDGNLLIGVQFTTARTPQIDLLKPDGTVITVAGGGPSPIQQGIPATQANLLALRAMAPGPDGSIYIVRGDATDVVLRVSPAFPGFEGTQTVIASPDGGQLYVFDADGKHLQTLSTLTSAVLFEYGYDANGRLSTITQKTGGIDNVTIIQHDASGNPTRIIGPFGQVTTLAVDANGFLNGITNPAGEAIQLTSDGGGLLQSYTDPRSKTSTFTYDADGRLLQDADPLGGAQNLVRATNGDTFTVTRTTTLGRTTTYATQNLAGNVQVRTITEPDTTQSQSQEQIDAGTSHVSSPEGTSSDMVMGPDPRFGMQSPVTTSKVITTPGGLSLAASGKLTASLSDPADPFSLTSLTQTFAINGRTIVRDYDASTRTLTTTSPSGRTSSLTIDSLGRVVSRQAANLEPTSASYDSRGRMATITRGSGGNARTIGFTYNAQGFVASITDPDSRTVQFTYDTAGRATAKSFPATSTVNLTYDAAGNLIAFTPPGRPAYTFAYSDRNELTQFVPPAVAGTGPTTYAYNVDKQLTDLSRPDGKTISLGYDAFGRLASRALAENGVTTTTDTFAYDTAGRISSVSRSNGVTVTHLYDGFLHTGESWSGVVSGSVTRTYDSAFRMVGQSVSGGTAVNFAYDADDLLIGVGALAIARDPQNGLASGSSLGTVDTSAGYNTFGEATNYTVTAGGSAVFANAFTRDVLGRVTAKTETIGGVTDTYTYAYDPEGQLTSVSKNAVVVESYVYDSNGNRTSATIGGVGIAATYDAQDRVTQYGGATYTYNAAGDLLTKAASGQTTSYQYDQLGNLLGVTLPNGTAISYLVDGANRRIAKKVNGTVAKAFLYSDSLRPIAELDAGGAVVSQFVYGSNSLPAYMIKSGTSFRIVTDQVGSVRLMIDSATGAVAQRIDYDSFGNVVLDTNPGFQPFGFAGGLYDPDTRLVRFGARDYEAETGRWTTRDPLLFGGADANLYRYVRNDPVNATDRRGQADEPSDFDLLAYLRDVEKNVKDTARRLQQMGEEGRRAMPENTARSAGFLEDMKAWAREEAEALRNSSNMRGGGGYGKINCGGLLAKAMLAAQVVDVAAEVKRAWDNNRSLLEEEKAEEDEKFANGAKSIFACAGVICVTITKEEMY